MVIIELFSAVGMVETINMEVEKMMEDGGSGRIATMKMTTMEETAMDKVTLTSLYLTNRTIKIIPMTDARGIWAAATKR